MIDNYDKVMEQWGGCCNSMVEVYPDSDLRRWAVKQTITVLANADYYYTKDEVDYLLNQITTSGVTREQVEEMINAAVAGKANQADLEALAQQVSANTVNILNTYTKQETNSLLERYLTKLEANSMFANYSKVNGTILELNAGGITI